MKVGARMRKALSRGFPPYPYLFWGPICLPAEIPLARAKHCAVHSSSREGVHSAGEGETNGQYLVFKCGLCDALLL